MQEENCFVIPAEQLRNTESEYFKKLEAARVNLKDAEKLKVHRMLFGLMDSVGGVREEVFEFFLNHNFECAAQIMRCKDLFSRLAEVGWFQLMFEEKSIKDPKVFPHWQEAIIRAYLADVPLEQAKKMYELAFVPIDLNRMVSVYSDKIQQRMEEIERKIMSQEEVANLKKESGSSDGIPQETFIKIYRDFENGKSEILSELKEERKLFLQSLQSISDSLEEMRAEAREYFVNRKEALSMRHDVAKSEEEPIRHDVAKPEEELSSRHDVVKPEEKIFMQLDTEKVRKENEIAIGAAGVGKAYYSANMSKPKALESEALERIDTGIQTISIDEVRKRQKQRLNVFALAYKKIRKNSFLEATTDEKRSELFNMLAKKKSSKEYMITVNLLMKSGMDMGVIYDFIERDTTLEELKCVLEAINSEESPAEQTSAGTIPERGENDSFQPGSMANVNEEMYDATMDAEPIYQESEEEDYL